MFLWNAGLRQFPFVKSTTQIHLTWPDFNLCKLSYHTLVCSNLNVSLHLRPKNTACVPCIVLYCIVPLYQLEVFFVSLITLSVLYMEGTLGNPGFLLSFAKCVKSNLISDVSIYLLYFFYLYGSFTVNVFYNVNVIQYALKYTRFLHTHFKYSNIFHVFNFKYMKKFAIEAYRKPNTLLDTAGTVNPQSKYCGTFRSIQCMCNKQFFPSYISTKMTLISKAN